MWAVTVRYCLPSPALLTWTIYFPALPPSSARGWPPTLSGSALLLTRVCHSDLAGLPCCSPLSCLAVLTAADALMARLQEHSPQPLLTRSQWHGEQQLCQRSSWHGKLAHPWRCHPTTTAKGLRCSFTTFSSYNPATHREDNLPNFLLIISRKAKQLQY